MAFYTEKQTEAWLESQTRDLPFPDGTMRPFTNTKLMWETVDSLILIAGYSYANLVEFALDECELNNVSFDRAFPGVVAYLDGQLRKSLGIQ